MVLQLVVDWSLQPLEGLKEGGPWTDEELQLFRTVEARAKQIDGKTDEEKCMIGQWVLRVSQKQPTIPPHEKTRGVANVHVLHCTAAAAAGLHDCLQAHI